MNVRQKAALALVFVVFELSFWSIFLKVGGSSIGIIPQLFYGFLVGLIVSLALSLGVDKGRGIVSIAKNRNLLLMVIVIGLLNNALTQYFLGVGTLGTNPSVGAVVYRSYIIFVALLTPFVIKQKVKRMQMIAAIIGFLGVYVILSGGTLFTFDPSTMPFMALLLISALCTTFSALFINKYTFNALGAVVIFNLASLIFMAGLAAVTGTNLIVAFTPSSIVSVLFLGAFAYGIGTALVYYSIKVYGPLLFGNVILLVPFLSILLAAVFTGTPIMGYYLLAAVLMSVGVILQRRYSKVIERVTSKRASSLTIFDVTGAFISNKNPAVRSQIVGGNRVLAVKLRSHEYETIKGKLSGAETKLMVYTNSMKEFVSEEEDKFISDILGLREDETALMCAGDPDLGEQFFGALDVNVK